MKMMSLFSLVSQKNYSKAICSRWWSLRFWSSSQAWMDLLPLTFDHPDHGPHVGEYQRFLGDDCSRDRKRWLRPSKLCRSPCSKLNLLALNPSCWHWCVKLLWGWQNTSKRSCTLEVLMFSFRISLSSSLYCLTRRWNLCLSRLVSGVVSNHILTKHHQLHGLHGRPSQDLGFLDRLLSS